VLALPGGPAVPLRADGFLADLAVAPSSALASALTLGDVEHALGAAPAADTDGVAAFGVECRQALTALRLRARHLPAALPPGPWLGMGGSVCYDAVAAARPHPAYPTAACRLGFTDEDSLRYAPEFWPEFELNWVAVPRAAMVTARPGRPGWWPTMRETGLPEVLADTHELMPVHPLTARLALPRALAEAGLAEAGLAGVGRVAPGRWLRVRPTLSTRTVVVTADPQAQLKLPLPVSTLGLRNRRALEPRTLGDGALVRRVLAAAADRDPGWTRCCSPTTATSARRAPVPGLPAAQAAGRARREPDRAGRGAAGRDERRAGDRGAGRGGAGARVLPPLPGPAVRAGGAAVRPVRDRAGVAPAERGGDSAGRAACGGGRPRAQAAAAGQGL
jgi:hypothetical protein